MNFKFKSEFDVNKRKEMGENFIKQYPDKIPIICEKAPESKVAEINKTKYLVPKDLTVSQFYSMLSKRMEVKSKETIFLLVNGKVAISGETRIGDV